MKMSEDIYDYQQQIYKAAQYLSNTRRLEEEVIELRKSRAVQGKSSVGASLDQDSNMKQPLSEEPHPLSKPEPKTIPSVTERRPPRSD